MIIVNETEQETLQRTAPTEEPEPLSVDPYWDDPALVLLAGLIILVLIGILQALPPLYVVLFGGAIVIVLTAMVGAAILEPKKGGDD